MIKKTPNENWKELNQRCQEEMKKGDLQALAITYSEMAIQLAEEGKNPADLIKRSNKMRLRDYKSAGFKKVKISGNANNGCAFYNDLNGKIINIDEALKNIEIPYIKCNRIFPVKHKGKDNKFPFCVCDYYPYDADWQDANTSKKSLPSKTGLRYKSNHGCLIAFLIFILILFIFGSHK